MAQALFIASAQPLRRAFISHATADDSYVAEMESFLRAMDFDDVFNDVSAIRPDEQFWSAIERGITESEALVVVVTAASNGSDWVAREVAFARSLGRKVIPVWIEECQVPPLFADRDVIDFRPRRRTERRIDIGRILQYAPEKLIGRDAEMRLISDAWASTLRAETGRPHILTFVALGGEGKTSLVAKWTVDEMHAKGWPGCDAAFAWSFYSQGTRDQVAGSSDVFLKAALDFFGNEDDRAFAASPAGAYEKGQRLARVVGRQRSLLILDGLEPLQYAPISPTGSLLKDQGLAALLKGLAQNSRGLCLATTRYSVPDLKAFWQSTAPEHALLRLSSDAGVNLLTKLDVHGTTQEYLDLVELVKGHALTLQLLGTWLRDAHHGDIRQHHLVKFEEADAEEQGGHAFRVMAAYEASFEREGGNGCRALALLRLLGLFDRPITANCFDALLQQPTISGLTDLLVDLSIDIINLTLSRLKSASLLTIYREPSSQKFITLDTHPLLREYFSQEIQKRFTKSWRAAHSRIYYFLCNSTNEGKNPSLDDITPLYQAIIHGCFAGKMEEVRSNVYRDRINKGTGSSGFYAINTLGAISSNINALACFFDIPWHQVSSQLSPEAKSWILGQAAYNLRAAGRLNDAEKPMNISLEIDISVSNKKNVAATFRNISELHMIRGSLQDAIKNEYKSLQYADQSLDYKDGIISRSQAAAIHHQAGNILLAHKLFHNAESIQILNTPNYTYLYSLSGFWYSELLLEQAEKFSWRKFIRKSNVIRRSRNIENITQRLSKTLQWCIHNKAPRLTIGLNKLSLGRAYFYNSLLMNKSNLVVVFDNVNQAINNLRIAGDMCYLPFGLVSRAWIQVASDDTVCWLGSRAQSDLDEAWDIAERGPMRLHMADIHLYRARLFFRETNYPWESPEADLKAARELIERCGYGRRREELADAETALAQWRQDQAAGTQAT